MKTKLYTMAAVLAVFALAFGVLTLTACNNGNNDSGGGGNGTPDTPRPFNNITAAELVSNIKVGWNLGNSLDGFHLFWIPEHPTVTEMETAIQNPVTTKAMITAVKNSGFNAIRIPVSWAKAADAQYTIRKDWMERVTEVVNYAVSNDMYIILNTHHDEDIFKFSNAAVEESLKAFRRVWEQIADNFRNYDEKLVFEGLNEPRTVDENAWKGGTSEEHANLNRHYGVFVDTVRASGGNNDKQILMINPYFAGGTAVTINGLTFPEDTVAHKLIVSIHSYEPYDFALNENGISTWSESNPSDKSAVTDPIDRAFDTFVSKGIPVIIGEFGAGNKANDAVRAAWAEFHVRYARSKGMPCFWWDNGTDVAGATCIFNRKNNTFIYPAILAGIMSGAGN